MDTSSLHNHSLASLKETDSNDNAPSQISQSVPTTPFGSSFDDSHPETKRQTQASVNGNGKASEPAQKMAETPKGNGFSGFFQTTGFQAINTIPAKVRRNQKSDKPNGDTTHEDASQHNPATEQPNPPPASPIRRRSSNSAKTQSNLDSFVELQSRRKSSATEAEATEPMKEMPNTKAPVPDTPKEQGIRKTRKSMPAKLAEAEGAENKASQSQVATPRPERKSKIAAQAKVPNSLPRTRRPRNLSISKDAKNQNNQSTTPATPSSLPVRTRRRNRKSSLLKSQDNPNSRNATPVRASARKREGPTKGTRSRGQGAQSPDSHSSNATEDVGVDGQADGPASSRISRRNRKPTMRAMESLESEKRYRRRKGGDSESALASYIPHHPDLAVVAQRLFELAAEAVSPSFVATPDAKDQLKQIRQEYWDKKERGESDEAVVEPEPAQEGEEEEEEPTTQLTVAKKTQVSEPWTDRHGLTHTGHVNEHGEEYFFVPPDYELYRPHNTYGDAQLPEPPVRLISREQLEKDRVFGFPPRMGERNVPRNIPFMYENVEEEMAKIKAREEARQLGIVVDRFMSADQIRALIGQHGPTDPSAPKESIPAQRGRRRRRTTQHAIDDNSEYQSKPRRRGRQPAWASEIPNVAPDSPDKNSPDKKSMKIKLKLGKGNGESPASKRDEPAAPAPRPVGRPRKRALSATGEGPAGQAQEMDKLAKRRRLSMSEVDAAAKPATPAAANTAGNGTVDDAPASASTGDTLIQSDDGVAIGTPSRGRPRRRAAPEFHHVEDSARRASMRKRPSVGSLDGGNNTDAVGPTDV